MLRSMTGFGRYYIEDAYFTQTWEIRSVNGRYLDIRWRLPQIARGLEAVFEKMVRRHSSRGRVEISLNLQFSARVGSLVRFNREKAEDMLYSLEQFAADKGCSYLPDYGHFLGLAHLWEEQTPDLEGELGDTLSSGLLLALEDWNESRATEAGALRQDLLSRLLRLEEWAESIAKLAPEVKDRHMDALRERLLEALAGQAQDLDENRFLQEIVILTDRLDVSEEVVRLKAHLERLGELLRSGADAGRRLDFTLQECLREINTCGNKIQDIQISRLVVDFKNELEKCREQIQNLE
ncbi:MAG: YicC family protein [Deltaproteobacteria bacterium]|jgi:uncharacterized protein (TIGR00255 family)|nr:YicC family protein [Deltaproteobacteria bacterium]